MTYEVENSTGDKKNKYVAFSTFAAESEPFDGEIKGKLDEEISLLAKTFSKFLYKNGYRNKRNGKKKRIISGTTIKKLPAMVVRSLSILT